MRKTHDTTDRGQDFLCRSARDVVDRGREKGSEEFVKGLFDFVALVDFTEMGGSDGERTAVKVLKFANNAVGVDSSDSDERGQESLINDHAILQRTERRDFFLLVNVDTIEIVGKGINDDMDIVKLGSDGFGDIISGIFAPNNMNNIVADVPFFVDLLRIVGMGGHARDIVEDDFDHGIAVVGSRFACGVLAIQTPHKARVGGKVDFPAESSEKGGVFVRAGVVGENGVLVFLAGLNINKTNFHHFAAI